MPIYAYRCEACGFAKDVLQKISDPKLTECPSCSKSTFKKQLTAAGFQLKGTGWYATDFRGGSSNNAAPVSTADAEPASAANATADAGKTPNAGANSTASTNTSAGAGATDSASAKSTSAAPSPAKASGNSGSSTPSAT